MSCGSCTLCCTLKGIKEIDKPVDTWCPNCVKARGCSIYESRPQSCRDYECFWYVTQSGPDPMPAKFRPDRSRVIIDTFNKDNVVVLCDPKEPFGWRKEPTRSFVHHHAQTRPVFAIAGKRIFQIFALGLGKDFRELREDEIVRDGQNVRIATAPVRV